MKDTVKRVMNFRFDCYEDIEMKLEKLALKGLFLNECGPFLWKFSKGTPKKIKYTVSYFSEGSVFNPGITDNQQTYFDYAKASGWNFVTQFNQMQIFCSEEGNPVPFETDEREKLENIKRCMKKSFLPSTIAMIIVFALNLLVQFDSFRTDPIDYLSDPIRLSTSLMIAVVLIYQMYSLISYLFWCRRSEKSIDHGGECAKNNTMVKKTVDMVFMVFVFAGLVYFLLHLLLEKNRVVLALSIAQMPILLILFWTSIKYMKKKKASAMKNRAVSFAVLLIADFALIVLFMSFIMGFGSGSRGDSDYRIVDWKLSETESHEFRLYSHEIPLTCEDLYGEIDYDYYSYESETNNTFFIGVSAYRQDALPGKDAPPQLEYEILETEFDIVYLLAKDHMLEVPEWRDNTGFEPLDNKIFDTEEAYQRYYGKNPTGEYNLFFGDRIIKLDMERPLTEEQISTVREKLQI